MNTPVSRSRHLHPTLVAVSALFASLVVAYGLDSIFGLLRQQAQSTFHVLPAALFATNMPLVLATIVLALAWIILIELPPSRAIATIFLAAGCLVIGTYLTQFIGFPSELRRTFIGHFRTAILTLGTHSSLYHLTSFWIVAGLACFLRRHVKTKESRVEKREKTAA